MSRTESGERERALLAALAVTAERLLQGPESPPVPEVLETLGVAGDLSRVALVAARPGAGGSAPRMESRQQWAAAGLGRLGPGPDGWPRYPARWRAELEAGTAIAGPTRGFAAEERAILEAAGARSALLVPVAMGGEWYGHLACYDGHAERLWSSGEGDAFHAAAAILGTAMHRRRVLAEVERRTALLRAVGVATSLLLEASNWRQALPRALEALRTVTRARSAWAYGPDPAQPGSRALLLYEVLAPGARPGGARPRSLELSPEAAARLQTAGAVHASMPDPEVGQLRSALGSRATSWAIAPMIVEPGTVGLLGIEADGARTWAEGELDGLEIVAAALRAAIARAGAGVAVPVVANPWGRPTGVPGQPPAEDSATAEGAPVPAPRGTTEDAGNLR